MPSVRGVDDGGADGRDGVADALEEEKYSLPGGVCEGVLLNAESSEDCRTGRASGGRAGGAVTPASQNAPTRLE